MKHRGGYCDIFKGSHHESFKLKMGFLVIYLHLLSMSSHTLSMILFLSYTKSIKLLSISDYYFFYPVNTNFALKAIVLSYWALKLWFFISSESPKHNYYLNSCLRVTLTNMGKDLYYRDYETALLVSGTFNSGFLKKSPFYHISAHYVPCVQLICMH
jgi:hypothetical protein